MMVRLVIGAADSPGVLAHAAALAGRLASRGRPVQLWLPAEMAIPRAPAGVDMRLWSGPAGAEGEEAVRALAAALGPATEPVIHHGQDSVATGAGLALRREGDGGAVVRTVHHLEAHDDHADDELQRATVQEVDACICITAAWARRVEQSLGVDAVVIPQGVDAAAIAAAAPARAAAGRHMGWGERPTVLTLGGPSRRKGSRVALEAFGRVRARLGARALLVVAGRGEPDQERHWAEDAARLGLVVAGPEGVAEADVVRLDPLPMDRMPHLYAAVDLLAYPSTREGSALAVLEAACAGVPAVVSDLESLRELLTHERHCLMVAPGDAAALSQALVVAMNDPARRAAFVRATRQVAERMPWEATAAAHERLYGRLPAA